jgi:hypothetical protein
VINAGGEKDPKTKGKLTKEEHPCLGHANITSGEGASSASLWRKINYSEIFGLRKIKLHTNSFVEFNVSHIVDCAGSRSHQNRSNEEESEVPESFW